MQHGKVGEGGIIELLPHHDLLVIKSLIIVFRRILDRRVVRQIGLDDDLAGDEAPSRPSRHLGKELKTAFRRPEVGHGKPDIRVHDPHQRHIGEVQPFGDHLGPDKNIQIPPPELTEDLFIKAGSCHGIGVHPCDPRALKQGFAETFDPFRACAGVTDFPGAALGTFIRRQNRGGAEVAGEGLRVPVIGVRHGAIRTHGNVSARFAHHLPGVTPLVEKEDRLFPVPDPFPHGINEDLGKIRHFPFLVGLQFHIDDPDRGQYDGGIAPFQHLHQFIFSRFGVVIGFHTGRGGPEDDQRAFQFSPHNGNVPGIVPGGIRLLVTVLMFLIHHDQFQVGEGGKQGRSCADSDFDFSLTHFHPFIEPFPVRQPAVQNTDHVPEPGAEAVDRLGSEGDFRHQHNGIAAFFQNMPDRLQIDFRLAAASDAVKKQNMFVFRMIRHLKDLVKRLFLVRRRGQRFGALDLHPLERIPVHLFRFFLDQTGFDQCIQHRFSESGRTGELIRR